MNDDRAYHFTSVILHLSQPYAGKELRGQINEIRFEICPAGKNPFGQMVKKISRALTRFRGIGMNLDGATVSVGKVGRTLGAPGVANIAAKSA